MLVPVVDHCQMSYHVTDHGQFHVFHLLLTTYCVDTAIEGCVDSMFESAAFLIVCHQNLVCHTRSYQLEEKIGYGEAVKLYAHCR
jgi:hypothetical protein